MSDMARMVVSVGDLLLDGEPWPIESFVETARRDGPFYNDMPVADPGWLFVDAAGHEHRWDDGEVTNARWVVDEAYWCADCDEEHEAGHTECTICGEHFEPGTHIDLTPLYFNGRTEWNVKIVDVDRRLTPTHDPIAASFGDKTGVLYVTGWEEVTGGLRYVTLRGGPQ